MRVSAQDDALDRFEAAWHLASGRKPPEPLALLTFAGLPLLMRNLTPARWDLLGRLAKEGPMTVYALAKLLERDYKNVHTDVARLLELGLAKKNANSQVLVPWQAIRAELRL
ncbi:MAG: MarR family transcriptional regulator [Burkholderiales bacterium]